MASKHVSCPRTRRNKPHSRIKPLDEWLYFVPEQRRRLIRDIIEARQPISIEDVARTFLAIKPNAAVSRQAFTTIRRDVDRLTKSGDVPEKWIIRKNSPFLEAMLARQRSTQERRERLERIVSRYAPASIVDLFDAARAEGIYDATGIEGFRADMRRLITKGSVSSDAVIKSPRVDQQSADQRRMALLQIVSERKSLGNNHTSLRARLFDEKGIRASKSQIKEDLKRLRASGRIAPKDYSERNAEIFCIAVFYGPAEAAKVSGLSRTRVMQIRDKGLRILNSNFSGRLANNTIFLKEILRRCSVGIDYSGWEFERPIHLIESREDRWINSYNSYFFIEKDGIRLSYWPCDSLGSWPDSIGNPIPPVLLAKLADALNRVHFQTKSDE